MVLERLGEKVYLSTYEKNRKRWYLDDGDDTLRITFEHLGENSIVIDLGGWKGEWASDIFSRYMSYVYVFEPVKSYADFIEDRFKFNSKIRAFSFGLGSKEDRLKMFIGQEGSSVFANSNTSGEIQDIKIVRFDSFLTEENLGNIDVLKINIEGGEYELLEYIVKEDLQQNIDTLLVQFHDFVENAQKRRNIIQELLKQTHDKIFDYPFVWECWKRR